MAMIADNTKYWAQKNYFGNSFFDLKDHLFLTESTAYKLPNIFHESPLELTNPLDNTEYEINQIVTDRAFVSARKSILIQYSELHQYYEGLSQGRVLSKSLKTLNKILDFNPDAISFELTHDQSIIFIFKIQYYTFFFQQYFVPEFEDSDEAILSTYKGTIKLPSHAGSIDTVLNSVSSYFEYINDRFEAVLNGLPY